MSFLRSVTLLLVVVNVAVFGLQGEGGDSLILSFGLWPVESKRFALWQLATYSFLHATALHLAVNMIALLMFAVDVERRIGSLRFLLYFFCCTLFAAFVQLAIAIIMGNLDRPMVGASGGVFGVLLAYGMLFPRQRLTPIIMPIPLPAWLLVGFYVVMELMLGLLETDDGIAHFAHLGGMMGGWFLMQYWLDKLPRASAQH